MESLSLSTKELKVLTWMDDVAGIANRVEGDTLVLFYSAMPEYWEQRISMEEVAEIIHDIYNIAEENNAN